MDACTRARSEETLLEEALTFNSKEGRAAYVERTCGGDPALRARLEALLEAHEAAAGFLEPTAQAPSGQAVTERPGTRIGRYKLLQVIGEGGMGIVYMAEQEEPVRRKVALKVIKLGMDTKAVVARFEAERQALALMDHPNIAKVLDAGATEGGRPYFVMEMVQGMPITRFCDEVRMPTRQRLELFGEICSAVQHAHQKGIIHRDLKPSNILVTLHGDKPVPKVIDFGIAKATHGRLTDKTLFTAFQQFIGTPAYMSPEQASLSGLDIDTRSDIYSLGVLLYELLTGRPPIDPRELLDGGFDEMRRIIREKEPPRPSTRLSTLQAGELNATAQLHQAEAPRLIQLLRGDLDWIVMKAIEKDRSRRYETANGVAADVRRHLENEPITARPPSTSYRLRKAFLRHKIVFAGAGAVAVALAAGVIATSWQSNARQRALEEARRTLYVAQMQAVQRNWEKGDIYTARKLLQAWIPKRGEEDLRGFEWRHFATLCQDQSLLTLTNEVPAGSASVAVSPDGSLVASGDRHGNIRLHRTDDWSLVRSHQPHTMSVNSVEFSRDGKWLASSGADRATIVMDVMSGQTIASLIVTNVQLLSCARFSPDARLLAVGGFPAETLTIFDLKSSAEVARFSGQMGDVRHASFSPDGRHIAINNGALDIQIRDVATHEVVQKLSGHQSIVGVVEYSPDGKWLASSEGTGTVKLWDTRDWREVATLHGHRTVVMALAFSRDSGVLASSCRDGMIRVWDVAGKSELGALRGHSGWVQRLAFLPGRRLLSAGDDRLKVWAVPRPGDAPTFRKEPVLWSQAHFSPDGRWIATLGDDESARQIWETQSGGLACSFSGRHFLGAFSPDSSLYAARGDSNDVQVWKVTTGSSVLARTFGANDVRTVAFAGQNTLLVTLEQKDEIRRLDLSTGEELAPLTGFESGINSILVSPDRRMLAAWCADGNVKVCDTETGTIRWFLPHNSEWPDWEFSPDSELLMVGHGASGGLHLWSMRTRELVHSFAADVFRGGRFAFSADGRWIALGSQAQVHLWDVARRKSTLVFEWGILSTPVSLAFAPDSRTVAVCDSGGTVRLLSVPLGREVISFTLQGFFGGARFSPSGNALIAFNVFRNNLLLNAESFGTLERDGAHAEGARMRVLAGGEMER